MATAASITLLGTGGAPATANQKARVMETAPVNDSAEATPDLHPRRAAGVHSSRTPLVLVTPAPPTGSTATPIAKDWVIVAATRPSREPQAHAIAFTVTTTARR